MKKHIRDCANALEENGFEVLSIDLQHRHPRINFRHGDREAFVLVSCTPKNAHDEINLTLQQARRALGIKGKPGAPRKRRHKRKIRPPVPVPTLGADSRRDFRDDLKKHPHFANAATAE